MLALAGSLRAPDAIASERILSIPNKEELCNYNSKIAIRTYGPGLGTLRLSLGFGSCAEKPQGQLALMKDDGEIVHAKRVKCEWRPWQILSEFEFPQGIVISQRTWVEPPFAHSAMTINGDLRGSKLVVEGSTTRAGKAFVSPKKTVMVEEMDPALKPCVLEIACSVAPARILLTADGKEWVEKDFIWSEQSVEYRMVYDQLPHEMTVSAYLGQTSDFLPTDEWKRSRRREGDVKSAWVKAYDEDFPDIECPDPRIRDLVQLCLYVNRTCALQPGGRLPYSFGVPTKFRYPMWWMWDSAFHAIPAAWMKDSSFAFGNLLTHTMFQSRKGCVMDAGGLFYGDTGDGKWIAPEYYDESKNPCTGPCVTGIAVWDVYQKTGSVDFLKKMYPHLVMYERWITKAKASGIDPDLIAYHNWYDVGWDDSKRWGKGWPGNLKYADIDWEFPVAPVDANVFFLKLREALSKIASILGDTDRAGEYSKKAEATGRAIDRLMWNEKKGFYFDILPNGRMLDVWTPAGLLPLMAGIPSEDKYRRMREHLFDSKRFWSKYPIPTVSLDDETFTMNMWSGGTWINVNWQVLEGLFGYDTDAALQLLWRTIDMMTKNGHPVCSEYYGPKEGEPKGGQDYGWTTLAMDLIMRRIFGISPKGDRVELNPHLLVDWPEAHVRNIFVLGTNLEIRYVRSGNKLKAKVRNNGAKGVLVVSGSEQITLRPNTEVTMTMPRIY
jgi:hypothetical protein